MHLLMIACIWVLLRMRSMPAKPFWQGLKAALLGR